MAEWLDWKSKIKVQFIELEEVRCHFSHKADKVIIFCSIDVWKQARLADIACCIAESRLEYIVRV